MGKLYNVTIELEMPVWATDEQDAIEIASENAAEELDHADIHPTEVNKNEWLKKRYTVGDMSKVLAWGATSDRKCAELLEKGDGDEDDE